KASALDLDAMPVYEKGQTEKYRFSGRRVKRGLYRASQGRLINADVNGSANIMRKVIGDAWVTAHLKAGKGVVDTPMSITHIDHQLTLEARQRASETTSNGAAA
ncbi:hypothetical protein, partial [Vreelandella rituensis]